MSALVVDSLLLVLLLAALAFAVVLHRRLKALQAGAPELERLIARLGEASDAAGSVIKTLRTTASETGSQLTAEVASAQRLTDELRLLTDRADRAAAALADAIRGSREPAPVGSAARHASTGRGAKEVERRTRTEIERALNQLR